MSGNSTSSSSFSSRLSLRRLPVYVSGQFRLAIGDRLSCKFDTGGY